MENLQGVIAGGGQGLTRQFQSLQQRIAKLEEQVRVLRTEQSIQKRANVIRKVDKPTPPENGSISFYARDDGAGNLTLYYQRPDGTEVPL